MGKANFTEDFKQDAVKQHDKRAATIATWPKWFVWWLSYFFAPENLGWPLG